MGIALLASAPPFRDANETMTQTTRTLPNYPLAEGAREARAQLEELTRLPVGSIVRLNNQTYCIARIDRDPFADDFGVLLEPITIQ